ncbi:unnamed protein product [Paramecium sonneborni]|uniref:Uncharacterized protein n=1 Tax=Paramecium sonneborni TaxID=65129 RepID=A0A8S1NC17_9CILI|nr:unnamed protein product [Paramecium sonneborni]
MENVQRESECIYLNFLSKKIEFNQQFEDQQRQIEQNKKKQEQKLSIILNL